MTSIVNKTKAFGISQTTGKLFIVENTDTKEVMFTESFGLPEKYITGGYVAISMKFPTVLIHTDPREHKKPIKNIDDFIRYYYENFKVIEE